MCSLVAFSDVLVCVGNLQLSVARFYLRELAASNLALKKLKHMSSMLRKLSFTDFTYVPAGLVVNHIAIVSEGLRFDSQAGKMGRSDANGSPPLLRFFGAVLPRR